MITYLVVGSASVLPFEASTTTATLGARQRPLLSSIHAFRRARGGRGLLFSCASHLSAPPSRFLQREAAEYARMGEERSVETRDTNVLFCGFDFPEANSYTREYLKDYPFIKVDDVSLKAVPDVIDRYHLCVVKNRRFDAELIARATEMKLLMQYGVGLEGVDVKAATQHNIKVARIPGRSTGNAVSCAEMAIYLILGLLRKQKEMDIAVKQKRLGEPIGQTLFGKTVFILGFGAIGSELAKRLRPFGVNILATKRKWPVDSLSSDLIPNSGNSELNNLVDRKGGPEHIYEFAGEADIVVTCLTMSAETAGIADERFLSCMKKGSLLVNIARGGILDYTAVYNHLESGRLGGLGIDVAWTEPFDPEDPILKFPNVIITPHLAGVTEFSYRTMAKVVGDCALQLHAGKPLSGIEYVN